MLCAAAATVICPVQWLYSRPAVPLSFHSAHGFRANAGPAPEQLLCAPCWSPAASVLADVALNYPPSLAGDSRCNQAVASACARCSLAQWLRWLSQPPDLS